MDKGYSHLDTFDVGRIEGLSSQPYWHQYDDRLPGLVGGIRGRLAQRYVTQMRHILFVHYSPREHDGKKCKMRLSAMYKCPKSLIEEQNQKRAGWFVLLTCTILSHIHNQIVDSRCSGYCFSKRGAESTVSVTRVQS